MGRTVRTYQQDAYQVVHASASLGCGYSFSGWAQVDLALSSPAAVIRIFKRDAATSILSFYLNNIISFTKMFQPQLS